MEDEKCFKQVLHLHVLFNTITKCSPICNLSSEQKVAHDNFNLHSPVLTLFLRRKLLWQTAFLKISMLSKSSITIFYIVFFIWKTS